MGQLRPGVTGHIITISSSRRSTSRRCRKRPSLPRPTYGRRPKSICSDRQSSSGLTAGELLPLRWIIVRYRRAHSQNTGAIAIWMGQSMKVDSRDCRQPRRRRPSWCDHRQPSKGWSRGEGRFAAWRRSHIGEWRADQERHRTDKNDPRNEARLFSSTRDGSRRKAKLGKRNAGSAPT